MKNLCFLSAVVMSLLIWPVTSRAALFCVNEQDNGTANADHCPPVATCDATPGNCSLRDAITKADLDDVADVINFSSSLTSPLVIQPGSSFGLPQIEFPLQITGPGAEILTIAVTDGSFQVFWFIDASVDAAFGVSNLTLTHMGTTGFPVKIRHDDGNLTVSDCVISGRGQGISKLGDVGNLTINRSTFIGNSTHPNETSTGAALNFGGGTLKINESTFSGNLKLNTGMPELDEGGGAIGIFDGADTTAELTNVTISGNQTNENGGGIWISDNCMQCSGSGIIDVTLTNVTIAGNTADQNNDDEGIGGGLFVSLNNSGASLTLNNTLIADNSSMGAGDPDCAVNGSIAVSSNGFNLVRDPTGCEGIRIGVDITGENPLLEALDRNLPGTTDTQALSAGSPAINAAEGAPTCPPTDQRGVLRPQGAACDIGAFEAVSCGDGTVGSGEECESGPCCDTGNCQFVAAGTSCDDGDPATSDDQCNGAEVCAGTSVPDGDLEGDGGCAFSSRTNGHSLLSLFPMLLALGGLALFRKKLR